MSTTVLILDGRKVNVPNSIKSALDDLDSCPPGGIATVHDYVSGTPGVKKCVTSRVSTINFIGKFHYRRLVAKWLKAAKGVELEDLDLDPKAAAKFDVAKAELLASYECSITPTVHGPNTGQRAGHVRCYLHSSTGIKCHLVTEKGTVDGKHAMVPVIADNGLPTVASIMVSVLQLHQTIHDPGEYGTTKSQAKTIAKNAIEKKAKKGTLEFKMLSLKPGKFGKLNMGGECVTSEQINGDTSLLETDDEEVLLTV